MNYAHTAVPPQSQQPTANSDLSEIPAELHFLNTAIDHADHELASLADRLDSVLQPIQPSGPSEDRKSLVPPAATPLGSSIQSARYQVERITDRLIDIRSRIGL